MKTVKLETNDEWNYETNPIIINKLQHYWNAKTLKNSRYILWILIVIWSS